MKLPDSLTVRKAREMLTMAYGMLEAKLADRQWMASDAPPPAFQKPVAG